MGTAKEIIVTKTPDQLTQEWTAFKNLEDMCNQICYRPSIRAISGFKGTRKCSNRQSRAELTVLADAYDEYQAARGDDRRAYRS